MSIYTLTLLLALTVTQALAQSNALSEIVDSEVLFAQSFSKYVYQFNNKKDVVCSPMSSFLLLVQSLYGAGGNTADELDKALALPANWAVDDFEELQSQLKSAEKVQVNIANRLIVYNNVELNEEYVDLLKDNFDSQIAPFSGSAAELADDVNSWVSNKTNHKIRNLINEKDINERLTKLILLNAVYFNGEWMNPFDASLTVNETFTDLNGLQYQVPTMKFPSMNLNHGKLHEFGAVFFELLYKNTDFKLVIVVHDKDSIDESEFNKLGEELRKYSSENVPQSELSEVQLSLPKFKIESLINLQPVLEEMNVKEMFTDKANFEKMLANGNDKLQVTKIIQKVFIDVNEVGSEAGAASESESNLKMAPTAINVNVPFFFFIESDTYGVLFQGHVLLPSYA